jgi:MFS family permease
MGAGYLHTGYYFGFFLAAVANYFVGARYGWRAMFALGGAPALLVAFILYGVTETRRWTTAVRDRGRRWTMGLAFAELFTGRFRRRTILNSTYLLVSIVGLWAGSVYVPASVTHLAGLAGYADAAAARWASLGTMLLSAGTILGCLVLPLLAEAAGRRSTLGLYFALMFLSISVGFGYVFYLRESALAWFLACLFFLGVGGANFAMYTLWLPEQYSTKCRASAFAFATSAARFIGAGITFLVGAGISYFGTLGVPVALTSIAFLLGMLLLPFGEETAGKPLPL